MLKGTAFFIILMIICSQAALVNSRTLKRPRKMWSRPKFNIFSNKIFSKNIFSNKKQEALPSPKTPSANSPSFKYAEDTRKGLLGSSLSLLGLTVILLIVAEFTGPKFADIFGTLAAGTALVSAITYMSSNAKNKTGQRKLNRKQIINVTNKNYRVLMTTDGVSELHKQISKLIDKEDLSSLSFQKPKAMFALIKKILKKNFHIKNAPLKKAIRRVKHLVGISA